MDIGLSAVFISMGLACFSLGIVVGVWYEGKD
jgi:hypothetical protein